MYSRSYAVRDGVPGVPDGYDGIAMREPEIDEKLDTGAAIMDEAPPTEPVAVNPWERSGEPQGPQKEEEKESESVFSLFGKGSLGNVFGGIKLPFIGSIKMPKIGTEELLILAAAAYLFFSKDGDKECAIILILLLFVT